MKKAHHIISVLFLIIVSASCTSGSTKQKSKLPNLETSATTIDHSLFNNLLQTYVSNTGSVNYAGFVKDKNKLNSYIVSLTKVDVDNLSKNEKLAFWINAYNALTLNQIIENYPISSILKIADGKVWDQTLSYQFNGKTVTLNQIEKKILLGTDLFDARIHFAVNCAAMSCPNISNKAFTAANVQAMLTQNTKAALANQSQNKIEKDKVSISMLFNWYKADFEKAEGSVLNFINKYSSTKVNNSTKIDYLEYNWKLNGK